MNGLSVFWSQAFWVWIREFWAHGSLSWEKALPRSSAGLDPDRFTFHLRLCSGFSNTHSSLLMCVCGALDEDTRDGSQLVFWCLCFESFTAFLAERFWERSGTVSTWSWFGMACLQAVLGPELHLIWCICITFQRASFSVPQWRMKPYPLQPDQHGVERLSNENGSARRWKSSLWLWFRAGEEPWAELQIHSCSEWLFNAEGLILSTTCSRVSIRVDH